MSDASEKPFAPTPSRIARARREGNLPRSQELAANGAFIAAVAMTIAISPVLVTQARACVIAATRGIVSEAGYGAMLLASLSVLGAAATVAAAVSLVQNGGFVLIAPTPKFSKLMPVGGIKRMFSRESVTHAVRALTACAAALAAIVASVHTLLRSAVVSPVGYAGLTWSAATRAMMAAAAVGSAFALVEFGVARRKWFSKLKMSLHDLKRELKESDGDPLARQRRRSLHRSLLRGALAKVKDASFVVVNPTHVAVALRYDPPAIPIPTVLVRAADEMALRVREAAHAGGIPIIENVPLARGLFNAANVGDPIPSEHYVAVAEIVVQLLRAGALQ